MSCGLKTNLEGLRFPSRFKAAPNVEEELFILGWEVVAEEVHKLREEGWAFDKKGRKVLAGKKYQAANIYFYLIYYALIIRNFLQRESKLNKCFNFCEYKIDCVEEQLPCLSKNYGTDYVNAWVRITELFGIDRQNENCDECCLGISQMVINDPDDCFAFIIGPCDENDSPTPPYGEFSPCEFIQDEFTKPVGNEDDIYGDC